MVDTFNLSHIICPYCDTAHDPEVMIDDLKELPEGLEVFKLRCSNRHCEEQFNCEVMKKGNEFNFETWIIDNDL